MRKTIPAPFLILGFAILVSTASAEINVTDAEAIYEVNFLSVDVPASPAPVSEIFLHLEETTFGKSLFSVSVPTEPSPVSEIFLHLEETTFGKSLFSVSVPTEPSPVREIFLHLEETTFGKNLSSVSVPTEPSPVSEIFLHLEEAKTCADLIFPKGLVNDITPPIITNVTITNITVDSATIKWNTDEVADSLVKYGKVSGIYTETKDDPLFVLNHTISLTGLQQGTTYYLVVNSSDQSENFAQSTEYNFVTVSGIRGDLNSDGSITPADAAIALRLAASGAHDPAADVSGDDRVTSLDALMILKAAAGAIGL